MCGRYTITVSIEELMLRYWSLDTEIPFHQPKYNVAPGQMVLAIVHDGQKNRLGELKWGLIPSWSDDPKMGSKLLNARSETVWEKPAFNRLIQRKRCILPADGFYEWRKDASGKQPMRIVLQDPGIFSLAALYDTWISAEGKKLSTCTVLTTDANELMQPIHHRMPVILRKKDERDWLDRTIQDRTRLNRMMAPYPPEELHAYPVTTAVGSTSYNQPDCIEPLTGNG
ncbi:SOS response-associated peptidase [Paenibacillus nasutitermitis]|uniref:Abasic site processing protein n=1 Tax=Paenibacillus nasutitermitis TaxID=1652958 RepID=A0A916YWR3_9BACL|nr:SOS response-associated peptidase [Paenibacillus nasutitermitis]GGD64913.1 putative SOS response-associated peptidase YoqW [Paenibacillus nasutitermitis]